jgi:SnoaL-like domain
MAVTSIAPNQFCELESIRGLKARYRCFVDSKQWDRLGRLFVAHATFDGFGSVPDGADPVIFVAAVSARLCRAITIHRVHTPEVNFTATMPRVASGL